MMSEEVRGDQFVVIRIEGMHCHRCELAIQQAILHNPGVHEVEVDFPSRQASVLFDPSIARVGVFIESVKQAGYNPIDFAQIHVDSAPLS